jgi:hypothetical protein
LAPLGSIGISTRWRGRGKCFSSQPKPGRVCPKGAQLTGDAIAIKKRAERRIGQLMAEMPKAKPAWLIKETSTKRSGFWKT